MLRIKPILQYNLGRGTFFSLTPLRPQGVSEVQKLRLFFWRSRWDEKYAEDHIKKSFLYSLSYDFLNRDLPVITLCEKLQIVMPENSFYVPSWQNHPRKKSWMLVWRPSFRMCVYKKDVGIWYLCYFCQILQAINGLWNGGHIGFLSYFGLKFWRKSKFLFPNANFVPL